MPTATADNTVASRPSRDALLGYLDGSLDLDGVVAPFALCEHELPLSPAVPA